MWPYEPINYVLMAASVLLVLAFVTGVIRLAVHEQYRRDKAKSESVCPHEIERQDNEHSDR